MAPTRKVLLGFLVLVSCLGIVLGSRSSLTASSRVKNKLESHSSTATVSKTTSMAHAATAQKSVVPNPDKPPAMRIDVGLPTLGDISGGPNDDEGWDLYLFDDFEDGARVWSNPYITTCGGVSLLGGFASAKHGQGEVYTHVSDLPEHTHVRIKAQISFIDNWETEFMYLKIDDRAVWSSTCLYCGKRGRSFCGSYKFQDRLGQYLDITVPHKSNLLRLTWGSTLAKSSLLASWGVSNLHIYLKSKCSDQLSQAGGGRGNLMPRNPQTDASVMNDAAATLGCMANQGGGPRGGVPVMIPKASGKATLWGSRERPGMNCMELLNNSPAETVNGKRSGIYWIDPAEEGPKTTFQVYCDMEYDGGGWGLLLAYHHSPMQNSPIVANKLPLDPREGYSHNILRNLHIRTDTATVLRFYCETDNHPRKVHFTTMNDGIMKTAFTGDQRTFTPQDWHDFKPLSDHTANIPDLVNSVYQDPRGHFTNMPFYQKETYHWSIHGGNSGMRWECDDMTGDLFHESLFQVWWK